MPTSCPDAPRPSWPDHRRTAPTCATSSAMPAASPKTCGPARTRSSTASSGGGACAPTGRATFAWCTAAPAPTCRPSSATTFAGAVGSGGSSSTNTAGGGHCCGGRCWAASSPATCRGAWAGSGAQWRGDLRHEYRRALPLIVVGAAAAWAGTWFEILRPAPGKPGVLLRDQRRPEPLVEDDLGGHGLARTRVEGGLLVGRDTDDLDRGRVP